MHRPLTVRILGAGVSGLSSAIALAGDGHEVELIDEHFAIPTVGTALGLFGPAQRVLERLGVLEEVRARSTAPRSGRLIGADGRHLATIPAGGGILVARSELVQILTAALPETVHRSRRRVEDVRPLRQGADLLVGADGVHSLVRRSGWPGSEARRHRVTVLRGTTDDPPPEISETWGGGWLFGITPLARGTNWFACVPEHRTGSREEDLAHLRAVVGDRREPIDAVLAAARPASTLVHGIHTAPPVLPVKDDVVLLGDAAHAMAPNLGHGANTALQDADALPAAIRSTSSIDAALRAYAARRTVPGQAWRLGSDAMLHLAMMSSRASLRDGAVGTLGAVAGRLSPVPDGQPARDRRAPGRDLS